MPRRDESFGMGALKTGAVISAVAGAYKFGEFIIKLRHLEGVDGDSSVFVRIMDRVRLDLLEVERLLDLPEVKSALSRNREKVLWIQSCIGDMHMALDQTNGIISGVKKGLGSWTWGFYSRVKWALHDHEKLQHRRMEVALKHLSILNVLTYLAPLEPLACCDPQTKYEQRKKVYDEAREYYRGIDEGRGEETDRYISEKDRYYVRDFDARREPEPERIIYRGEPEPERAIYRREEDIVEVDDLGRGYGDEYVVENGSYYRNREEPYEERQRVVRVEEDEYREREYEEERPRRVEMVDYERREVETESEPRHRHKHTRRVAHHHHGGSRETVEKVCPSNL
jgi:hypothetical protein